jgi:hypothetical protein
VRARGGGENDERGTMNDERVGRRRRISKRSGVRREGSLVRSGDGEVLFGDGGEVCGDLEGDGEVVGEGDGLEIVLGIQRGRCGCGGGWHVFSPLFPRRRLMATKNTKLFFGRHAYGTVFVRIIARINFGNLSGVWINDDLGWEKAGYWGRAESYCAVLGLGVESLYVSRTR